MPEEEFLRFCNFLKPYISEAEEFTIEVNPDDVDDQRLDSWKRGGVNRLSLGVQTFEDLSLNAIGRRHDSKKALEAFRHARNVFSNVSIDLMFGLPGQSLETWHNDLRMAVALRPEHISAYSLTYEEGTALTALRDSGRISEASEETTEKMFLMLIDELSKAGYEHYEISNFALPGFRSRHNSSYWLQLPYIGLGPSAHSYDGYLSRQGNRADLRGYLDHWAPKDRLSPNEDIPIIDVETLTEVELFEEYVLTRMRMREGIQLLDFRNRFGDYALERLLRKCKTLSERGLILQTDINVSLTQKAILLSDSVILNLCELS